MSHCPKHGNYDDSRSDYSGCPACRWNEEQERTDRELSQRSLYEIANQSCDLGDYDCPYCLQTSLRRSASRCPLCRGEIAPEFWITIRRQEESVSAELAAAQAIAAQRKKADEKAADAEERWQAPERQAKAEVRARTERHKEYREGIDMSARLGAGLGGLVLGFSGCVSCSKQLGSPGGELMPDFNLFTGLLWGGLAGAIVGVLLFVLSEWRKSHG